MAQVKCLLLREPFPESFLKCPLIFFSLITLAIFYIKHPNLYLSCLLVVCSFICLIDLICHSEEVSVMAGHWSTISKHLSWEGSLKGWFTHSARREWTPCSGLVVLWEGKRQCWKGRCWIWFPGQVLFTNTNESWTAPCPLVFMASLPGGFWRPEEKRWSGRRKRNILWDEEMAFTSYTGLPYGLVGI